VFCLSIRVSGEPPLPVDAGETRMRLPVLASSVRRSSSTLTPLLPITMPGLAAWMVTVIMFAERSISTLETPASAMRVMMC